MNNCHTSLTKVYIPEEIYSSKQNPRLQALKNERLLETTCLTSRRYEMNNMDTFTWERNTEEVGTQSAPIYAIMDKIHTFVLYEKGFSEEITSDKELEGVTELFSVPCYKLRFIINNPPIQCKKIIEKTFDHVRSKAKEEACPIESLEYPLHRDDSTTAECNSSRMLINLLKDHKVTNLILPMRLILDLYDQYKFEVTFLKGELDALNNLELRSEDIPLGKNTICQWDRFLCKVKSRHKEHTLNSYNEAALNELIRKITEEFPYRNCRLHGSARFRDHLELYFGYTSRNIFFVNSSHLANLNLSLTCPRDLLEMIEYQLELIRSDSVKTTNGHISILEMIKVCSLEINKYANHLEYISPITDKEKAFGDLLGSWQSIEGQLKNVLSTEDRRGIHSSNGYNERLKKETQGVVGAMLNLIQAFDPKPSCRSPKTILYDCDILLINILTSTLCIFSFCGCCPCVPLKSNFPAKDKNGFPLYYPRGARSQLTLKMRYKLVKSFDKSASESEVLTSCDKLKYHLCRFMEFIIAAIIYIPLKTYSYQESALINSNDSIGREACMHILGIILVALLIPRELLGINKLSRCHINSLWEKASGSYSGEAQHDSIEIAVETIQDEANSLDDAASPLLEGVRF